MSSKFVFLAILIALSAVFSGSETALVSLSKSKVDELVAKKIKNGKILKKLTSNPHRLLITVLIGNNVVNIGSSAYAAILFTDLFASSGVGIATGVMTFLILVFGEITPKSFCHQYSVGVSLFMAKPIYFMQILFFPFVWLFEWIVRLVNLLLGSEKSYSVTEGELVAMLKIGAQEGSIEKHEKELIENVLEFNDIEVEDVMTPRVSIGALDSEMTIREAVDYAKSHSHSRLPVYVKDLDHIIGIISIKTLLQYFDEMHSMKKLKNLELLRPIEVPLSKKINTLFREFQRKHIHLAVVIDEYGGTAGIVTLEDLLEEIVGEIVDESDIHEAPLEVVNKNTIVVSGHMLVEDINDYFRVEIGEDEHATINTMMVEHLHRFPREGETIELPRAKVRIIKMDKNVIEKAEIQKKKKNFKA